MNNLITNKFLQYLISRNVSALTLKNYRSDLSYFSSWIINKINSIGSSCEDLQEALPFITKATASEYKDYLVKASVPAKTINRRLSTLRTLSKFFLEEDLLGFDFASGIENITSTPLAFPVEKSAKEFEAHLATEKISPVTIKNYTADINQFTRWTKNLGKKGMKDITSKDIKRYLVLEFSDAPQATTDRKTSSLKKFFNWAKEKQIIEVNPIDGFLKDTAYLKPLSRSLDELTTKKLERRVFGIEPSYKTIQDRIIARFAEKPQLQKVVYKLFYTRPKWYQAYHSLAITRYFHFAILVVFAASLGFGIYQQFFSKAKVQLAYPETPVTPNRYLSFQGRLTNQYNTPVTDSSTIKFELYDDETETGPTHLLWDSSDCEVVPDQDGIFNVLLGTTTGEDFSCPSATAIGADVFSENAGVWLQMTTETETMDPRVQIATVAYALNADTVQGFPVTATVSATKSSIVVMDKNGQVVLGEVGPTLKSVAGNFAIEGQTITLQTAAASNGDINISPNGTGSVNITSSAQSDDTLYITNAQTTTGALIHGYFGNDISSDVALLKIGVGTTEATVFSVDSEGDTTIASGADYHIGIIGLSDNGSSSSGASLIGLFDDDMDYVSGSPTVQSAIKQLDTAISGVSDASGWHDDGDIVRLVTSANRVGIGTTSVNASTKLGVLGAAAIGSQSYSDAAAPTNGLIVEGTVGIGVTASTNAKVEILQSNNTLYGLYVSNTGGSTGIYGFSSYGGNGTGVLGEGPTIGVSGAGTGSGTGVSGSSDSGIGVYAAGSTFDFYANTSSASNYFAGNVGIGTTTPLGSLDVRSGNIGLGTTMAPTQKLDIQGNMRLTGLLYDVNNQAGNDGQILSKTTTGVDWVDIGTIGISGTGTTNYVPRWASSSSLTNSSIYDDGANVGIGTTVPSYVLDVSTTSSLRTVNITSNVPATTSNLHGIYVYANDNDGTSSAANVYGGYFHANATGGAYEIAGVYGTAEGNSAGDWYGVWGQSESKGVYGQSTSGTGVYGQSTNYFGVFGAGGNVGVYAAATNFDIYAATPTAKNYFAGNVGIGITDPTQKLSVSGNVGVSTGVVIGANSESISIGATDDTIQVTRGGSTYTVCDSSGNCGSGTGATKWNGIQSPDGAQTLTMAAYNSTWNWATLNTGTALNFNVAALTTGVGIGITGGGTTALTSGNIISVTGPTGAAALS
jgi:site-specific recombinase XerD